jgi:hypothetical protein
MLLKTTDITSPTRRGSEEMEDEEEKSRGRGGGVTRVKEAT